MSPFLVGMFLVLGLVGDNSTITEVREIMNPPDSIDSESMVIHRGFESSFQAEKASFFWPLSQTCRFLQSHFVA